MNDIYEKIADIVVEWWADKSFQKCIKQDINSTSVIGMMQMHTKQYRIDRKRELVSEEQIKIFKDALKEWVLIKIEDCKFHQDNSLFDRIIISNDRFNYDEILLYSCESANIENICLPLESYTIISDDDDEIIVEAKSSTTKYEIIYKYIKSPSN